MNKINLTLTAVFLILFSASCTTNTTTPSPSQASQEESTVNTNIRSESKGTGKFTQVNTGAINKDMAAQGSVVFNKKCISCHTLTEDKLVGPGLKGITKIRTPEWIMNMTFTPEEMAQKDPVAKELRKQYKLPMMIPAGITEDECRQVLEYLRENGEK